MINSFIDKTVASCVPKDSNSSVSTIKTTPRKAKSTAAKTKKKFKLNKQSNKKPSRPLSAYNIFFRSERKRMLNQVSDSGSGSSQTPLSGPKKVGFAEMARRVAQKWNKLDEFERRPLSALAREDKARYHTRMAEWKESQIIKKPEEKDEKCSLQPLEAFATEVSIDSSSTSTLPFSDMMALTEHVTKQAKVALYRPIVQELRNADSKETRDLFAYKEGHCYLGLDFRFSSYIDPIEQEFGLDPCKVEMDPQGTVNEMTTNGSLKTLVELSEDAEYSKIFDYLAGFNAEEDQKLTFLPQYA